jgi:hypothetical protein
LNNEFRNNLNTYAKVDSFRVENQDLRMGNCFSTPQMPKLVPEIDNCLTAQPYGFLGFPRKGTPQVIHENTCYGYYDNRIPLRAQTLGEGECMKYSDDQVMVMYNGKQVQANPNNVIVLDNQDYTTTIKNNIKETAGTEVLNEVKSSIMQLRQEFAKIQSGWGIIGTKGGLHAIRGSGKYGAESNAQFLLPKFGQLTSILDKLVDHVANITSWVNAHTHPSNGSPPSGKFKPDPYFKNGGYDSDRRNMKTQTINEKEEFGEEEGD